MRAALAEAALGLVGVPFRLHGRDPATGLDCVGLVAEALRRVGGKPDAPEGYSLRSVSVARFLRCAAASGLTACEDEGDIVLCRTGPMQSHLAVRVPGGFVHAHASLGRVTFLPAPLPWPISQQWRLTDEKD